MDMSDLQNFGIDIGFPYKKHYENYIGGRWVAPSAGQYFDNLSPITGQAFCEVPRSDAADVDAALDAAHAARKAWGETSVTERAGVLLRVADRMEQNLRMLAVAETIDNGKPLRDHGRRPAAGHRSPALFRRLHPGPGRRHLRNRQDDGRLPFP